MDPLIYPLFTPPAQCLGQRTVPAHPQQEFAEYINPNLRRESCFPVLHVERTEQVW